MRTLTPQFYKEETQKTKVIMQMPRGHVIHDALLRNKSQMPLGTPDPSS